MAAAHFIGLFGMDGLGFRSCWMIVDGDSASRWHFGRGQWFALVVLGHFWCVLAFSGVLCAERALS